MGKSGRRKKFAARWAQSAYRKARKERERAPPTGEPGQAEGVQEPVPGLEDRTSGQPTHPQLQGDSPVPENTTSGVTNRRPGDLNDLSSNDGDTDSGAHSTAGADEKFPSKSTSPKERKDCPQTTPPLSAPSVAAPSSLPQEGEDRIVLRLRRKSSSTDEGEDRACPVGFEKSDEYEVITDTDSSSEPRRSKHREDPTRRRRAQWSPSSERPMLLTDSESESATEVTTPRADSPPPIRQQHLEQRKTYKGANSPLTTEEARRRKARGKTPVDPETPWRNKWYWKTSDESDASHSDGSWSNSGYETPVNKWDRPSRSLSYNVGGKWSATACYGKTFTELARSPPPSPPTPPVPPFRNFLLRTQTEPSPPPPDSPRSPRHPDYPIRHGVGNETKPMSFYRAPEPVLGWAGPGGGPLPSTSIYPDCQISKFEGFSSESDEEQTGTTKKLKSVIKKARKKRKPKKRLKKGVKAPEYCFSKKIFVWHGHGIRYLARGEYPERCTCVKKSPTAGDQPKTTSTGVYAPWTPPHTRTTHAAPDFGDLKGDVSGAGTPPTTNISSPSHAGQGDNRKEHTATTPPPSDLDKADRPTEESPVQHTSLPSADVSNAVSPARVEASANAIAHGPLPQDIDACESGQENDRKEHTATTPLPGDSDKVDRPKEESPVHHTSLPSADVPNTSSPARPASTKVVAYGPLLAIDECETQAAWETGGKTPPAPHTPVPDPWSETSSSSEPTDALGLWYKKYLTQNEPQKPVIIPTGTDQFLLDISDQNSDGCSGDNQPISSQIQLSFKQSASPNSDSDASTSSSTGSSTFGSSSTSHDSHMYQKKRKHDESEESSGLYGCPYPSSEESSGLYGCPYPSSSEEHSRSDTSPSFGSSSSLSRGHKRRRHDDTSGLRPTALVYLTSSDDSNTGASHRSKGSCHSSNGSGHSGVTSRGLKRKADDSLPNSKRFRRDGSKSVSGGIRSHDSSSSHSQGSGNSRSSHSKGSRNSRSSHSKDSRNSRSSHSKGNRNSRSSHSKGSGKSRSSHSKRSRNNREGHNNSSHRHSSNSSHSYNSNSNHSHNSNSSHSHNSNSNSSHSHNSNSSNSHNSNSNHSHNSNSSHHSQSSSSIRSNDSDTNDNTNNSTSAFG